MSKHTPGPWETSRDAVPAWHTQVTVYDEASGQRVATVFRADAVALIASAPYLLKALEAILNEAQIDADDGTLALNALEAIRSNARAAIDKAVQS